MSRSSPVESSPQAALHPRLQLALGRLDIDLDDELVRYRRSRGRRPVPLPPTETPARPSSAANPIAPPPPSPTPDRSARSPLPTAQAAVGAGVVAIAPQVSTPEPPPSVPAPTASGFDETVPPDDYLASSEELLRRLSEDEAELRTEQEPGLLQTLLTPLGIGSMLLLLLSSVTFGYLFTNPNNLKFLGLEKLLKTAEPKPSVVASPLPSPTEAQPSAISPDLSQDEFVDLNLATLSTLPSGTASPVPAPTVSPATVATQPTPSTVPTVSVPATAPAPTTSSRSTSTAANPAPAPRASSSTSTRTTTAAPAQRSPSTTPARPSSPPRQTAAARPTAPAPAPAPAPAAVRPPASPTAAPRPAQSSAPVAASTAPPRQDLYYVVTDYTGDNSLDDARQAVGDAYVRNLPNRAVVQMGAFSEAERAQQLQRDLEQQGISAQVYQADP